MGVHENANTNARSIGSIERTFNIIELIMQQKCSTLAEFAERLNCSESTVHYYLKTLERNEYIVRDGNGYRIGLRFLTIGDHARRHHEVYRTVGREALETLLDELSERTGEIAVLAIEECGRCLILYSSRQDCDSSRDFHLGATLPLHRTAVGTAILSTYSEERLFDTIEGDDFSSGGGTPSDPDSNGEAMIEEIHRIHERGFAFNDQTRVEGERGIAVPVPDERNDGRALCSVGIVGASEDIEKPDTDLKSRRFMRSNVQLIQQTAQAITNKLHM